MLDERCRRLWAASDALALGRGGVSAGAAATGLRVQGGHCPPGTRQWPTIEHGLCSHITPHGRGRPLVSHAVHAVIVGRIGLIGHPTTQSGLRLQAALHRRTYPTGGTVRDAPLAAGHLERDAFHGDWNDTIAPHTAAN